MTARKILYVDLAPAAGGSVISLYHLVRGLNRERYLPLVLLAEGQPLLDRFQALPDVAVRTMLSRQGRGDEYPTSVETLRQSALLAWLRELPGFTPTWQAVGSAVRLARIVWPAARRLQRIITDLKPDLLHLNDAVPVVEPGIIAAWLAGVPAVCHVRTTAAAPNSRFDRWLSGRVAGFIFISSYVAQAQEADGLRIGLARTVYNGVALDEFRDVAQSRAVVRAEFGIPMDASLVGAVGRLARWKGHARLLQALAQAQQQRPDLHALIVGGDSPGEVGYRAELEQLAEELGLAKRVHFIGHREDVPRLLGALDALVHVPDDPEPFGRAVIEAMAAGLPVIAAAAGALPEIIVDGETGWLVPSRNPVATADAIVRLLADPAQARRMGAAGRQRVQRHFTVEQCVAGVEALYEKIWGSNPDSQ